MNTGKETITVAQVAKRLGRGTNAIQHGLRTGQLPFGTAMTTESGRYVYIIPREAFERYLSGERSKT
jgi:hypothetical protein